MNRFRMMAALALVTVGAVLAGPAVAYDRPELRVAYLHDGPAASWAEAFRDSLGREVAKVLGTDWKVVTPPELRVTAQATRESCREGLLRLMSTPGVDLLITTGPLGSVAAGLLPERPVPVIGTYILNPGVQGVPLVDGRSGVPNFTYVTAENLLVDDLMVLAAIVDFDSLAVVAGPQFLSAIPLDSESLRAAAGSEIFGVSGDGPVEEVLASLPPGTDAVYLMPLVWTEETEIVRLLAGFRNRKLPVVTLRGAPEVEAGALVGVTPSDWFRRVYRRVANSAQRITAGEEAANLPVLLARGSETIINARTARAIGVSPSFKVLIDGVIVDDFEVAGAPMLDIFMAMTEAQHNNQDIASARRAAEASEHEVSLVASRLLPQIYMGLDGTMIDDDRAEYFAHESERTFSGNLSLTQIIWSDRDWANYSIAKNRQDIRYQELMQTALNVGLEAATAYLEVLRSETDLVIQRQNLAFSRTNLERARIRVTVGDADRSEVYRWESKIAAEKADVIASVARRKTTGFSLNRVLNRPLEAPFDLEDATLDEQLTLLANPRVEVFTGDPLRLDILREFLAVKGLAAAPELLQLDAAIKAQQREYKASTRSFWAPTIGLTGRVDQYFARGGVGADMSAPGLPDDTDWGMGVFLSLPLFEGGGRFAETRRTTQEVYRLQRLQLATSGRLEVRVRDAVYRTATSRISIDLFRDAAEAARLNLELVSDNYTLGRASLVDLIDSQTNALQAQLAAANAVYGHLLNVMDLERAVGRFTFFAGEEARAVWIDELEAFAAER